MSSALFDFGGNLIKGRCFFIEFSEIYHLETCRDFCGVKS